MMFDNKWKLVPLEPTEAQWSGLARHIVMWAKTSGTGAELYRHLKLAGILIPDWLRVEIRDVEHVPAKGDVAAAIYRAMLAAAPSPPQGQEDEAVVERVKEAIRQADSEFVTGDLTYNQMLEAMARAALAAISQGGGWQPIESAPKDGREIIAWCRHDNWQYAKSDEERAQWEGPVFAQWTEHNKGGWTWYGMSGVFIAWQDTVSPPPGTIASPCGR